MGELNMIFLIFEQKSFKPFLVLKLKLFALLWRVSLFMRINLDTRAVLREYLTIVAFLFQVSITTKQCQLGTVPSFVLLHVYYTVSLELTLDTLILDDISVRVGTIYGWFS